MTVENLAKYDPRFVKSADGTEICTDAIGNRAPGVPTIVLIHGGMIAKGSWNPMFEDPNWISRVFLVRYDTRGHGRSGKPVTGEGWESKRIWEDFEAVCKEFGVTQTYVLGWSLGSGNFVDIVSFNTSIGISGLINVAGIIKLGEPSPAHKAEIFELLAIARSPPSVDAFQESTFNFIKMCSDRVSPDHARVLLEEIMLQPRRSTISMTDRDHNPDKLLQEARDGRLPLLAISCGKDKTLNCQKFKTIFDEFGWKNCTVKHLDNADHMPWVSTPELFRKTVIEWVTASASQ